MRDLVASLLRLGSVSDSEGQSRTAWQFVVEEPITLLRQLPLPDRSTNAHELLEREDVGSQPLAPLAALLLRKDHAALLSRLKEIAPGARPRQLHAIVEALGRAIREGALTAAGALPVDYLSAAERMQAAVHRALVTDDLSESATPDPSLVEAINAALEPRRPRRDGIEVLRERGTISRSGCAALRAAVDAERSTKRDSVDDLAEHQLDCSRERLVELLGWKEAQRVFTLPDRLLSKRSDAAAARAAARARAMARAADAADAADMDASSDSCDESAGDGGYHVDMFIRRYTRDTRPWINFHCDVSTMTANIALNDDEEFGGGRLLAILDGRLQVISRREGEATVHDKHVYHGVSEMRSGVRYTLIVFYYELRAEAASEEFRAVPTNLPVSAPASPPAPAQPPASTPPSPSFGIEIRQTAHRGMGVFASRDLAAGERLLAETALVQCSADGAISDAVDGLSKASKAAFHALCSNPQLEGQARSAVHAIWLSNAYPTDDDPPAAAVFATASRFNHSCNPNAHQNWNAATRRMTVHALESIPRGEEITISYRAGTGEVRAERRAALLAECGFECCCPWCELKGEALAVSDRRQAAIAAFAARIQAVPVPKECVRLVEERLRLMEQEGTMARTSWDTCAVAMTYLNATGEPERAKEWAARAAACAKAALGDDSEEYASYAASAGFNI